MKDQNIKYLIYSFVISILIIYIFKNFYSKNKMEFLDSLLYSLLLTFIFFIIHEL